MDLELAGRVAIVTGAASGIGRATARRLAAEGARLVLADWNAQGVEATAAEVRAGGADVVAQVTNVADAAGVAALAERALDAYGHIDVLAAIAGISSHAPVVELTEAAWREVIDVHLTGTFLCCRAVLPTMLARRSGAIVAMSSMYGYTGWPEMAHYAAAKAGIAGFVRALAREVAAEGVRVNAVAPGLIRTPLTERRPPEYLEARARTIPLGRLGTPEDIADVFAFLAGAPSRFMTGQIVSPNGGEFIGS
jgi:3-oxoacyl-[acyl-carrier protein] reductase